MTKSALLLLMNTRKQGRKQKVFLSYNSVKWQSVSARNTIASLEERFNVHVHTVH
jgi:hypothetical protein